MQPVLRKMLDTTCASNVLDNIIHIYMCVYVYIYMISMMDVDGFEIQDVKPCPKALNSEILDVFAGYGKFPFGYSSKLGDKTFHLGD